MAHEIKLYGDIVPFKWYNDGSEYDLKDLNSAISALEVKENDEVIVDIHTFGGCTVTAFAMYNKLLRFKKDNNIKLSTRIDGYCASAGVIILLAGDRRIGNDYAEPFVHNAWTFAFGVDKNEAKKISEDLTKVDNQISKLYEDRTSITQQKALELMAADTWLSPEQCMEYGFYTELENVYAPENKLIFNSIRSANAQTRILTKNSMTKNSKNKGFFNELKKLIGIYEGSETTNKIIFTAENEELDFYELDDTETPSIGDKATFDGKPAGESNDGKYVMASGETYVFEGEELKEILAADDNSSDDSSDDSSSENSEELEKANATISDLQNQLQTANDKIAEQETTISSLNKRVSAADAIVNKFKSMNFTEEGDEDEDDEDEEDEHGFSPRDSKKSSDKVPTRNLFQHIK